MLVVGLQQIHGQKIHLPREQWTSRIGYGWNDGMSNSSWRPAE